MDMTFRLMDGSQHGWEKRIAVGIGLHLIILERQGQVLVHEQVDQRFLPLGQMQVMLFCKLQHRTLRQEVHAPFTHITLLTGVDAEE